MNSSAIEFAGGNIVIQVIAVLIECRVAVVAAEVETDCVLVASTEAGEGCRSDQFKPERRLRKFRCRRIVNVVVGWLPLIHDNLFWNTEIGVGAVIGR
jgi:hypothetical protein